MRRLTLIWILATACPAPPAVPDGEVARADLAAALDAWRSSGDAHTDALSLAASAAQDVPIGDRAFDLMLAEALSEGLLRPDLAKERIEPYVDTLTGAEGDLWLNVLLRLNDGPRLTASIEQLHGVRLDPEEPALRAAMSQAILHRSIRWKEAVYAHEAGKLAARQIDYGRPEVDQPFKRLDYAMEGLTALLPGWQLDTVVTRTRLQTDPDPMVTAGEIPVQRDTRRVVSYATDPAVADKVLEGLLVQPPQRIVGLVVRARRPDREFLFCGEGTLRSGQYWMISGCNPQQQLDWMRASEYYADLIEAGTPPEEVPGLVRERWGQRFK